MIKMMNKTKTYNIWQLYTLLMGCMFDDKKLAQEEKITLR
ncbi:hypothetical protein AC73_3828 [Escherichia coli 2-427-07_S4_C1]|nr:hypothetical protein G2583_pO550112 [Escherichia coli O55:H7 str. CB9615]EHV22619.1 hypothetical protein ECDEC5A_3601 [Escherichia coli DEC5A]EHV34901.1 hypothetical protein ECDEC5D_4531 [Escherichia coli DEC5D]EHV47343.1 hypothetical protein ECDEC5C_5440 [Escherichia coli DEC5C]KDY40664.1 hypothetical protein AC73_3828 [Escherichia coli 2-427-07_S4_C1]